MKKLITLFFLFSAIQSYSQEMFETDWHLLYMYVDGQEVTIPVNDEIPFVAANFIEGSPVILETGACASCSGEITIYTNFSMTFDSFDCTLNDCFDPENQPFDNLYSSFFMDNINTTISYYYVYIDGEGTYPDEVNLVLTAENGDEVYYTDLYYLSTSDFIDSKITVFPNPVTNEFFISIDAISEKINLTIYNIVGEIIITKKNYNSNTSIDVQNLNSGIYFVSIQDENGNTSIKKILKE